MHTVSHSSGTPGPLYSILDHSVHIPPKMELFRLITGSFNDKRVIKIILLVDVIVQGLEGAKEEERERPRNKAGKEEGEYSLWKKII